MAGSVPDLAGRDIHVQIARVDEGPQRAPSLFAWIEHVCDWEQLRRRGENFRLCRPEEAIESGAMADAALVSALLRTVFGKHDPEGSAAAKLMEPCWRSWAARAVSG